MSIENFTEAKDNKKIICCKCGSVCKIIVDYFDKMGRVGTDYDIISAPLNVIECPICGRLVHVEL